MVKYLKTFASMLGIILLLFLVAGFILAVPVWIALSIPNWKGAALIIAFMIIVAAVLATCLESQAGPPIPPPPPPVSKRRSS